MAPCARLATAGTRLRSCDANFPTPDVVAGRRAMRPNVNMLLKGCCAKQRLHRSGSITGAHVILGAVQALSA